MRLIGEKVVIRELRLEDAESFYEFGKNSNIGYNAGWKPFGSMQTAKNVLFSHICNNETFCISNAKDDSFIGTISLYSNTFRNKVNARNLGFSISEELWGNGYATEAIQLMLTYAFGKLKVDIVACGHFTYNKRSERLIQSIGFTYEGLFRQYKKLYTGDVVDAKWYSMTKEEFERMRKNEGN